MFDTLLTNASSSSSNAWYSDWNNSWVAGLGFSLYFCGLLACGGSYLLCILRKRKTAISLSNLFHLFLALMCIGTISLLLVFLSLICTARMTWFLMHAFFDNENDYSFGLNRLGFLFFFTDFTIVILYWYTRLKCE